MVTAAALAVGRPVMSMKKEASRAIALLREMPIFKGDPLIS